MREIGRNQTIHTLVEYDHNGVTYVVNISHFNPKDENEITENIERRVEQEKNNLIIE